MMQGDQLLEGVVVRGRVEIDTRKPFRSVKEAVALFGERIHAGEVNKLKEIHAKGSDLADLNETRQSLRKEKEEEKVMLDSLRQQLEQTKKELYQLKAKEKDKPAEIEEIKFVSPEVNNNNYNSSFEDHSDHSELHRKRSVKFASPPLLTKVITSEDDHIISSNIGDIGEKMNPLLSNNKIKKKPLVPLFIGKLFSKKQRSKDLTAKSRRPEN